MIKCKSKTLFGLLFVLLMLSNRVWAHEKGVLPFSPGEIIHYNVNQMAVKAGEATLEFKGDAYLEGKTYSLVIFTAQGFNFYDEERIYLERDSFLPVKIMRDLNIFGNKENIKEEYLHQDGLIKISKLANGKVTEQSIRKMGQIDNIYGFIYRTRLHAQLVPGAIFEVRLPTIDITMKGLRVVKFNAAGETYSALLMKSEPAKYSIWFDTSAQKYPLRIAGALGLANTVMTMTGVEYRKEGLLIP